MKTNNTLKLIKATNCNGCLAYNNNGCNQGICILGFNVIQLEKNFTSGKGSFGDYWAIYCKPSEPCMKPKTKRQYLKAMKNRILKRID